MAEIKLTSEVINERNVNPLIYIGDRIITLRIADEFFLQYFSLLPNVRRDEKLEKVVRKRMRWQTAQHRRWAKK